MLRGPLPEAMPDDLARSVQLHRRIDAATDRHPAMVAARAEFGPGARRYAGIVLDLVCDHVLAQDWGVYSDEPLGDFVGRAASAVAAEGAWFEHGGSRAPAAAPFATLLLSYGEPAGLELAARRTAGRLRQPQGLLAAMQRWPERLPGLRRDLPVLLADLRRVSAT